MAIMHDQSVWIAIGSIMALILLVALVNVAVIKLNGSPVPVPTIPRGAELFGEGKPLRYAVLGDSTTIAQGSDYDSGYVRASARFLAGKGYRVELTNFGVSGARASDVAADQAPQAAKARPDIVLVAVSANDVTHLTPIAKVRESLSATIATLRSANPDIRIIITGSPQMGTVPRFPQPSKLLARLRSNQTNTMAAQLARDTHITFAPIAAETGPAFARHPEYYAADKFHPNKAGYALWTPVITQALSTALGR
jgi:lysophospholipase L1-like esterase